jgi:nucleotide-binding universal stress UspA family protein
MSANNASARMPYQIVVGFDFSELGERAVQQAIGIARHNSPSELHVVTVAQRAGALVRLPRDTEAISEELARDTVRIHVGQLFDEYQASHGALEVGRIAINVAAGLPVGDPAKLIVALATEVDADVIVIGTHGRSGLGLVVLGSVAQQVVRDATTSVYVVRAADFVRGRGVRETVVSASAAPLRYSRAHTMEPSS